MSRLVEDKLFRLQQIVDFRLRGPRSAEDIGRMRAWVMQTEHILSGAWVAPGEELTNEAVGERFDAWIAQLSAQTDLRETEQSCLGHFIKVSLSLRPHLIQCYELEELPRTNNEMEQYIRHLKTRYRRISERKNWNAYLLRYGASIAYYDWLEQQGIDAIEVAARLWRVDRDHWRRTRQQSRQMQSNQLKTYRFRHRRKPYLQALEARWAHTFDET